MNDTVHVFILAAGLGERLRPITNHIPKPLVPLLGKPALQHVLDYVSKLNIENIGVNAHYKMDVVESWIAGCGLRDRIRFFAEQAVLGTGGALKNAEALLAGGTFLTHNSDVVSDIDLSRLLEHHRSSANLVTLAVHDYPAFNNVAIGNNGRFDGVKDGPAAKGAFRAFTGIAVYEPEFLRFLPHGPSRIVDAWQDASEAGEKIGSFDVSGCFWADIGTPASYAKTVFHLLRNDGENVYVHPDVKRCNDVHLQGYAVIENAPVIDKGASLRNCIVLPRYDKGNIRKLTYCENSIIGPDYLIELDEKEILPFDDRGRQCIGAGGSGRAYFRVRDGKTSYVHLQCEKEDADFERQVEYTRFFQSRSIPVPALIRADYQRKEAVFEDAGDISLYSYLKCPRDESRVESLYEKIMEIMVMFHAQTIRHASDCPILAGRVFDYEYFRWETDYFIERFVRGHLGMDVENGSELERELDALASRADSFPKTVIHRDFQSQNIMVVNEGSLRIIDYQGARIGPPAYDAASILWDPYCRIQDDMRERLLNYYTGLMTRKAGKWFRGNSLSESIMICRLQRHMQALGAYAFLAEVKGKTYFLKHVPEAMRLLKDGISASAGEYPVLHRLITGLEKRNEFQQVRSGFRT